MLLYHQFSHAYVSLILSPVNNTGKFTMFSIVDTGVYNGTSRGSSPSDSATLFETDAAIPSTASSKEPLPNIQNRSPDAELHADHVFDFDVDCEDGEKPSTRFPTIPPYLRVQARHKHRPIRLGLYLNLRLDFLALHRRDPVSTPREARHTFEPRNLSRLPTLFTNGNHFASGRRLLPRRAYVQPTRHQTRFGTPTTSPLRRRSYTPLPTKNQYRRP